MKTYRATLDSMIAGRPVAKGDEVKGLSEDRVKAYLDAGLIEEDKPEAPTKEEKKADAVFSEAAKKIDTSSDKRTEK